MRKEDGLSRAEAGGTVTVTKMMNVREVAAYLNIKERKVYDLVRERRIPCSRVAGKWLFPQHLIDDWVAGGVALKPARTARPPSAPPVVAGSHDPLLEWSLRESGCGLALMAGGSLDGLRRLAAGEAQVCGLHLLDEQSGTYNLPAVRQVLPAADTVLIEWAWRRQGLVTAKGNPLGLQTVTDLRGKQPRVAQREPEAGTHVLLVHLLAQAGIDLHELNLLPQVVRSHTDAGLAILEGRADAALAVAAVAHQLGLSFVPLQRERYDLALGRRDYFQPPFQHLLAFTRDERFHQRAGDLGYDISGLGSVRYNAP